MDCAQLQAQLELFVLKELPADAEHAVHAHLAICPNCEAAVERCRRLTAELARAARTDRTVSLDLARRVAESTGREIRAARRQAWARRALAGLVSVAAAGLVLVGLWQVWPRPAPPGSPTAGPAAESPATGRPVLVDSAPPPLRQVWQQDGAPSTPMTLSSSVVVRGQRVYLLRQEASTGRVAALDSRSGRTLWTASVPSIGYISADEQRVYCLCPTDDGRVELAALAASNGRLLWRYRPDDPSRLRLFCAAVVAGDGTVCWSTNRTVHLIDSADGQAVWRRTIPEPAAPGRGSSRLGGPALVSAAAAVGDDLYVAGGTDLYCLSGRTGQVRWQLPLDPQAAATSRPLLDAAEGRLYAAAPRRSGGSRLVCIAPQRREAVWTRDVEAVLHLLPRDGRLFVRGPEVIALDAGTGEPLWHSRAAGCSPITYANGVVYFVDASGPGPGDGEAGGGGGAGSLIALDGRTGRQAWRMPGLRSCEAFLTAGDTGYLKTQDGVLHAMALRQI